MKDNKVVIPESLIEDLRHCFKCGMCQQVCPTFKVTRKEYYAPRGRVQIVKHYLEGDLELTPTLEHILTSCMLCDACAASCPSGVRIDRLFRNMRIELDRFGARSLPKKLLFSLFQNGGRLRKASRLARIGQKIFVDALGTKSKIGNIPLARLPKINSKPFRRQVPEKITPEGKRSGRVIYFTGCATDHIYDDVGHAVLKVLGSLGLEILIPGNLVCCSAPMFLSGAVAASLPNIFKNLDILDRLDADAIVVDCATCGAALKKAIPELLEDLGLDTEQAKRVAGRVKDVSQIVSERLDELPIQENLSGARLTVTYHDPCHLVRGMGVAADPRKILSRIGGIKLIEMEGSNECCGGGGYYQFDNVDISGDITSRKRRNIMATGADIVATGCPGCRLTLHGNLSEDENVEVAHTMQLLSRSLNTTLQHEG
ncbi:MAG: (Fe-S)-binding protein [Pseudomonadota bacterium]